MASLDASDGAIYSASVIESVTIFRFYFVFQEVTPLQERKIYLLVTSVLYNHQPNQSPYT
jgi:hypothetical protein